jgi:ATP-binding cassette subfamily F protein uup
VRRELDWIRRGPQARSTKQKARIDRFNEAVDRRPEQSERPQHDRRMGLRLPTGGRLGKTILEIKNLSKSLGGKLLFSDLTLLMKPGDRIGIVGRNGAGKTTLVRTLLGDLPPDSGEVVRGFNTRIAFLDQGRSELNDANSVLEEVAGDNDHVILEDGAIHVRSFLRLMLFDDRFADAKVSTLSGGERNRVQLAKLLRRGGNLLVLDEPTNDLDLLTLSVLEDALVEFPGCALVVSHDRWFLDKIATGILAFEGNGQVTFHEGNYSDYHARLELAAEAASREAAATAAASKAREAAAKAKTAPTAKPEQPAARRMSFKEQKELEAMESTIGEAEQKVSELQAVLNDPAIYKDRASEVTTLIKQLEDARAHVEALYSRWQALEELQKR